MIVKIANHDNPAALWRYINQTSPARTGGKCVYLCGTQTSDPGDGRALVREFREWSESRRELKYKFRQFLWRGHATDDLSLERHAELVRKCVEEEMGYNLYTAWLHVSKDHVDGHCLIAVPDLDGRVPSTKNERWRLRSVAQGFEREHGLIPTQSHSKEQGYTKEELQKAERLCDEGKRPSPVPPKMALAAILKAAAPDVGSIESLKNALAQQGVTMGFRTDDKGRRVGTWFEKDGLRYSGSSVGFPLRELNRLYENNDTGIEGPGGHSPAHHDPGATGGPGAEAANRGPDSRPRGNQRTLEGVPRIAEQRPQGSRRDLDLNKALLAGVMAMRAPLIVALLVVLCCLANADGAGGGRRPFISINIPL
jgi:hypothetical protein